MKYKLIHAKRMASFMSILCAVIAASAQSLSVQTNVTGVVGMPAVKVDDVWHATSGASVHFNLTFVRPELSENQRNLQISSVVCEFNGETKSGTLTNSNTFEFTGVPMEATQMATFSLSYSYEQKKEEKGTEEDEYEMITAEPIVLTSEGVRIWETPTFSINQSEPIYNTEDRTITIHPSGGADWSYSWNGEEGSTSYTETKPSSVPQWVDTEYEVKNYAPDGTTEWLSQRAVIKTYFYNQPIVNKVADITETNYYKSTGSQMWELSTTGGGSKYEISWTGGEQDGTGLSYSPFPNEVSSAQMDRVIQAVVVNKADDDHELYRETITFGSINVYPAMHHEKGRGEYSIYSGEQIQFSPTVDGDDNPGKWEYSWSNGLKEQSLTDNPTSTTTYTLQAQYMYNGSVWDTFTETYTANVYEKPSFKTRETIHIVDAEGNHVEPVIEGEASYSQNEQDANDYHLIVGDKIDIQCVTSDGVPSAWNYHIYVDDEDVTGTTFVPSSAGTYHLKVTATNGEGVVEQPFSGTITRQYIVYDQPQFATTTTEIHTFPGESATFDAPVTGGDENGWSFLWNDGTKGTSIDLSAGSVSKKTTETHTLTASYVCEGITRFADSEAFNLVVWPQPKTTGLTIKLRDKELNKVKNIVYFDKKNATDSNVSIECYDGDILDISYAVEGGYTAESGCWTYQNSVGSTAAIVYTAGDFASGTGTDTYSAVNASQAFAEQTFDIAIKNAPNLNSVYSTKEVWLNDNYKINVKIWHKPSISEMNIDSASTAKWKESRVDVYAGGMVANNLTFSIPNSFGNTGNGGWSYSWQEDSKEVSRNESEWTYVPQSASSTHYTDKTLSVHITNKIGDNYGLDETFKYPIRIWNRAAFASGFSITDNNRGGASVSKGIREGNTYTYKLNPIEDGYFVADSTSYVYEWSLDGASSRTSVHQEWFTVAPAQTGKSMVAQDITDGLTLYNYGPYGHVWEKHVLPSHPYRVYHKPETPESIKKKGNFATGTLAVSMPSSMSDTELNTYDYNLVFGYVDDSGNDVDLNNVVIQGEAGTVRWYQLPSSARSHGNYYVYAQWKYMDGATITSGKRYLNPKDGMEVDELWDGSNYDAADLSTRAFILGSEEATAIHDFTAAEGYDLRNASTRIYSVNGQRIENTKNLERGTYLLETVSNGKRMIKKLFVK